VGRIAWKTSTRLPFSSQLKAAEVPASLPPQRLRRPGAFSYVLLVAAGTLVVHGWSAGAKLDLAGLPEGISRLGEFLVLAVPPDLARLGPILTALLVTFEMALLGTIIGVTLSVPLAVAAARNTAPHPVLYIAARGLISVFRTIPDLIWGIIFVVAVGLGPEAGVLAIAADVMGFCGRFFAESIEEIDGGVIDGLRATGASRSAVVVGAVLPSTMPSFVATSMFALESSTRSSVVLGLVGAGGIGIELTVSMQLLRYDEALTIIIAVFFVVIAVERLSSAIRRRLL
jgi:phosphonate transport system permease protein